MPNLQWTFKWNPIDITLWNNDFLYPQSFMNELNDVQIVILYLMDSSDKMDTIE